MEQNIDRFFSSLSWKKILARLLIGFGLILIFNLSNFFKVLNTNVPNIVQLISNIQSTGNISYIFGVIHALSVVYWTAFINALAFLVPSIRQFFGGEILGLSTLQILLSFLLFAILIFQTYGITGTIFSYFYPNSSNLKITIISILLTFTALLLLSLLVSGLGLVEISNSPVVTSANTTIINSTISNLTNSTGEVPVINLI